MMLQMMKAIKKNEVLWSSVCTVNGNHGANAIEIRRQVLDIGIDLDNKRKGADRLHHMVSSCMIKILKVCFTCTVTV
jgi:hypothetical protein